KASSLLDVCCGTGLVTIPLSKKLSHVVGIDFSSSIGKLRYTKII
ncbi:methyltransferase domain-containing protein, partial [Vibrio sp. 03_296]